MKNPQRYKQFYKAWNELTAEIIMNIRILLLELETKSIDLTKAVSQCTINEFGLGYSSIARGIVLHDDQRITLFYGEWEPDQEMDVPPLDTHQLLRLYNVMEESFYDWEAPPFNT